MSIENKKSKPTFHARNKHQGRYDFDALVKSCSELKKFVRDNPFGQQSIDFFDSKAVKTLNQALLKYYYAINWDIPEQYLCPPIPGRADYIHHLAGLLGDSIKASKVRCLDVGVGANCIYPIIGVKEYDWDFVGSDIDSSSLESARKILSLNPDLQNNIQLRLQENAQSIFDGVIQGAEKFDLTLCNPPFHESKEAAQKGTLRKLKNLKGKPISKAHLNFGGKSNELWCEGGEIGFVERMILESKSYAKSCTWFTTLISKERNLKQAYRTLKQLKVSSVKTIPMGQGQKKSRILAWSFQVVKI